MPIFRSPGLADADAPAAVLDAWNARILAEFQSREPSPILVADPATIQGGQPSNAVKWPGHPLEPMKCEDEETAEKLSDWGWAGRAELHNEYLEYTLVMRTDNAGRLRPKRFIATTELMEWWRIMAVHAPDFFLSRVQAITGLAPSMVDLFGVSSQAWMQLPKITREDRFRRTMVGDGRSEPPLSSLNPQHALFMSHGINGLDDLIYVVHFGSFPYAVREGAGRRRANIEEIFNAENVPYLFCRNADPAAAEGAYNQAFIKGTETAPRARKLAFNDPLGMYMRTFSTGDLFINRTPIPENWTRWSRGNGGTPQRLEFGPADNERSFLDDVTIGREDDAPKLTGYQIAKRIEVGPIVVVGEEHAIPVGAFRDIPAAAEGTIACGTESDSRCADIAAFKREFDNMRSMARGTRGGRLG